MLERPLHIALTTTSDDAQVRAFAESLSHVLSEDTAPRGPIAVPAEAEPSIDGADVVIALDAVALDNTRSANVGLRVAYWPGLGDAWDGSVEAADLVLVTHETQIEIAITRGAAPSQVVVVGPLSTSPALLTREEARKQLLASRTDVNGEMPLLLIPTECLPGADLSKLLTQLTLVRAPFLTLFDVGDDVERAKDLRQLAPRFGVQAALFSEKDVADLGYRAASRVLVNLDSPSALRAVASETPLLVLKKRAREQISIDTFSTSKLVAFASLASLAITLDEALSPESVAQGRAAAEALEATKTPARIREAIRAARENHTSRSHGLPRGLEFLDRVPGAALARELEPLASSFARKKERDDAAIEAELAELKKRIGG